MVIMKILYFLLVLTISNIAIAQKTDVRVQILDINEEVKKMKIENQKLSTDLSSSIIKYENRLLDLGAKIEDLRFEINVLKRVIEQYKIGVNNSNPTANSIPSSSTTNSALEDNSTESKPQKQSYSQCSATTKKGTRCSRSARSNGLCWQHGG